MEMGTMMAISAYCLEEMGTQRLRADTTHTAERRLVVVAAAVEDSTWHTIPMKPMSACQSWRVLLSTTTTTIDGDDVERRVCSAAVEQRRASDVQQEQQNVRHLDPV